MGRWVVGVGGWVFDHRMASGQADKLSTPTRALRCKLAQAGNRASWKTASVSADDEEAMFKTSVADMEKSLVRRPPKAFLKGPSNCTA